MKIRARWIITLFFFSATFGFVGFFILKTPEEEEVISEPVLTEQVNEILEEPRSADSERIPEKKEESSKPIEEKEPDTLPQREDPVETKVVVEPVEQHESVSEADIPEPEITFVIAPEPDLPIEVSLPPLPELTHLDFEQLWIKDPVPEPEDLQLLTDELMALILDFPEPATAQALESTEEKIPLVTEVPPVITVLQPLNQKFYRSSLTVQFTVSPMDRIEQVYWDNPYGMRSELQADEEGLYFIHFNSSEYKGPLSVRLGAVKDNGLTDEVLLSFEEDTKGPSITLFTPEANQSVQNEIIIEGTLAPLDETYGSIEEVSSLRLYPPGSNESIELVFDSSGDFSITLDELDFEGINFLNLEAEDKNSHIAVLSLPVKRSISEAVHRETEIIEISSPVANSFYNSQIAVEGQLLSNDISEFYWSMAGELERNTIEFSNEGSFSFRITAVDMNKDLQLLFTAISNSGEQSQLVLPLKNDRKGPSIVLETPEDNQYYKESLRIKGTVEDFAGESNEVKSLYWSVSSMPDERNLIFFEDDGTFDFELNSQSFHGKILFQLTASDLNNNQSDFSVEIMDGKLPPVLQLSTPLDGDKYGAGITVSGKVSDPYGFSTDYGGIEGLHISLKSSEAINEEEFVSYSIPLITDGSFSYVIPVTDRSGTQELEFLVSAANGNQSVQVITLDQSEFAIADFQISQGNESLSLQWTEVPFIQEYRLTYIVDGTEQQIRDVNSPLDLKNLENGSLYTFTLEGVYGEDIVYSPVVRSIPMSEDTLEPFAKSEFGFMEISWLSIEGTDTFRVFRADEKSEYIDVSGDIRDTRFIDRSGIYSKEYSYRIVPSGYEQVSSYPVSAHLLTEPPERLREKDSLENITPKVVRIYGDYVYVLSQEEGFYIVDISNPEHLSIRGFLLITGGTDLHLMDDYAVVATGSTGFSLINISEPASPRLVGSRRTTNALAVSGEGEFIYIADGEKGYKIYSLSDPLRPPRITADPTFPAYGIHASGDRLYVSSGEYGLNIYNIEDPNYPEMIGHYSETLAFDCVIQEDYSFIAAGNDGIVILDISDPDNPTLCSKYSTENARSLTLKGNHLYIADGSGGLVDVDVTDPYRPVSFEKMSLDYTTSVDASENLLLVADKRGLRAVETYQYGQSFKIGEIQTDGSAASVAVHKGLLYVSDHSGGLVLIDGEEIIDRIPTEYAESVFIEGDRLYLADGRGGVKIYAIRDELILLEQIEITGQAVDVEISDDRLYIAARSGGLQGVESLAIDSAPLEAGDKERKRTADWIVEIADTRQVAVKDAFLYCADRQQGLVILDISSPGMPQTVREIDLPGAIALTIEEDNLYAAHARGITLFDISEGQFPEEILTIESPYVEDITVNSSILYAALGHEGLAVYNINKNKAQKVSECTDVFADSVTVSGQYAYIADSTGVNILKIHIPQWIR